MVSISYNFFEFVNYAKDKNILEIISLAQNECYEAEKRIKGGTRGAPRAREEGCPQYVNLLKGLIFFLANGVKPGGVNAWDLIKFKPIVESLVQKGMMKGDFWLKFFDY